MWAAATVPRLSDYLKLLEVVKSKWPDYTCVILVWLCAVLKVCMLLMIDAYDT